MRIVRHNGFNELLKRCGVTPKRLADRLGVSLATVSRWGMGRRRPNAEHLKEISEICGVSVDKVTEAFNTKRRKGEG